tara:strand:- start:668 stop:832 length:165 start_codon:yes stop_codon:yes gene_type:complete
MKDLKINRGIELMLRRPIKKEQPKLKGFGIKKTITLLKRKVYFNFDIRWEKTKT